MNPALMRTLELLLIILIGYLLQRKLSEKKQLEGVKLIILNVALPATIFIALLKIDLQSSLLLLPLGALAFNLTMFAVSRYTLPWIRPQSDGTRRRTLSMLLPSLAPGLSCFPFIMAYLDDASLAMAALADVGNKFFGLILLYLLAMHWYHRSRLEQSETRDSSSRLKGLMLSLIKEPINVVIVLALVLLVAGWRLEDLPKVLAGTVQRFSVMMVALVLLFIGMAVRVSFRTLRDIMLLLSWRSGVAMLCSALFLLLFPGLSPAMILLVIVFPQSSCSFWPFAHMHLVSKMEEDKKGPKTFDLDYAVNVLACSLPYSSLSILLIFNFGEFFSQTSVLAAIGASLAGLSVILARWKTIRRMLRPKTRGRMLRRKTIHREVQIPDGWPLVQTAERSLGELRDTD